MATHICMFGFSKIYVYPKAAFEFLAFLRCEGRSGSFLVGGGSTHGTGENMFCQKRDEAAERRQNLFECNHVEQAGDDLES